MSSPVTAPLPTSLLPEGATIADGVLHIRGIPVPELAERYGTPLFIYDEDHVRERCREAIEAFHSVAYAAKAFFNKTIARVVTEEGLSIDVASGGELFTALAAGAPPARLVLHGNAKSRRELAMALEAQVGRIVVDGFDEMERLEQMATAEHPVDILVRVTPGVSIHTHDFIKTGQDDSKFGFTLSTGKAQEAVKRAKASDRLRLRGIHIHVGSQVLRADSFAETVGVIAPALRAWDLPELSLGGGLGVTYATGETAPDIAEWSKAIHGALAAEGLDHLEVGVEPGRAIVAGAAVTVYTVETVKELPGIRTYVAVDGGMSDNPRPSLYGSDYEVFDPVHTDRDRPVEVRVVGKHCESGDVLVDDGFIPKGVRPGDLIATPVTGAYGHSMGSNYNKVLRAAVVFVNGDGARLVVRRERYEDLLATDLG